MLNNKNILVTGGAGFIGSHLVERLLQTGSRVTVIDDLSEGTWKNLPKKPNLTTHKVSILEDLSKFVAGQDMIFHLAAIPWPQKSVAEPWLTHKVNVDGTLNLLLEAKKHKVKRFIFSSSYTVYPRPLVPYSLHKLAGEEYCKLFSNLWGLETVCLRYFNVYGPGMRVDGPYANLIPKFIKLMSQDKVPVINGDGEQTRDFIYVGDVVEANLIAAQSAVSGKVFNIGRGESVSINNVVEILNRLLGKHIQPIHNPEVVEPRVALAIHTKASKLPGWEAKVKFEDGIKIMLP